MCRLLPGRSPGPQRRLGHSPPSISIVQRFEQVTLWFWPRILAFVALHTAVATLILWFGIRGAARSACHVMRTRPWARPRPARRSVQNRSICSNSSQAKSVGDQHIQSLASPRVVAGEATMLGIIIAFMLVASPAAARDFGQWENQAPQVRKWFQSLIQPDAPFMSCCGEADAYWADSFEVDGDRYVAIITDERPDGPLGRPP